MHKVTFTIAVIMLGASSAAFAQSGVAPTPRLIVDSSLITENFDSLSSTTGATSAQVPSGFGFTEIGVNSNGTYGVGNGSNTSSIMGNTYSFGATDAVDRAFGTVLSVNLASTLTGAFTNNTGGTLNTFTISYFGETWRVGTANESDRLDFAFAITSGNATVASFLDGNSSNIIFEDFDSLDYTSTRDSSPGMKNGNNNLYRSLRTGTFNVNLAQGETLLIRFKDSDGPQTAENAMGIDDLSFQATFQPVPSPSSTVSVAIGGLVGLLCKGARTRRPQQTKHK